MRKLLSLLLIISMLAALVSAFTVSSSAAYASADVMGGYENLVLTYTHNPNSSDYGRHTPEDLKPYVGYYDADGNLVDFFFDSYLFLPCMSYGPSGARLHYDTKNPTKAIDWTNYVEDTFHEGTNVDALEVAFGEAKLELNDPDRKAGVVLSILYPGIEAGSGFGSLGGKELDFTKTEDRKYAIKWIIDEQMRLYSERDYEHLELVGFYWLEEYLSTGNTGKIDIELFNYTSDYLHSLGLKFVWIPWFKANGYNQWRELGFDAVTMQPNMYWQPTADDTRVSDCLDECSVYGMGMEMECDAKVLTSGEYYNRYLDYLKGSVENGAMSSVKMYYQDGKTGVYYKAWKSTDARARSVYDLTYKYAKGTLTVEEIDSNRSEVFALDEDVDWISIGKPYTASKAYSDGSTIGYQQNDGKELTDGVIGQSDLDTEWHAFHKTLLDPDKRMSVTVDLGEVRDDITHFMIHFSHVENYGIDDPADDVAIYISDDGENYKLLAQPKLEFIDISAYIDYVCKPVTARYVKYSFINSNANFVFCSEALVGVGDTVGVTEDPFSTLSKEDSEPQESNTDESAEEVSSPTSSDASNESTWIVWTAVGAICVTAVIAIAVAVKKKKTNS